MVRKFFLGPIANWQVDRLAQLIEKLRSDLKSQSPTTAFLLEEHLNQAEGCLEDALSSMEFNQPEQASYAVKDGLGQIAIAQLLMKVSPEMIEKVDDIVSSAREKLSGERESNEAEEKIAYLGSCLAQMKSVIEYSNVFVGNRVQSALNLAMDYYNDALKYFKKAKKTLALRAAQAGLLELSLAANVLANESMGTLKGWRGIDNPTLGSPLRKTSDLISELSELSRLLKGIPEELQEELSTALESAWEHFDQAMKYLSEDRVSQAQALIKAATLELRKAKEKVGPQSLELADGGRSEDLEQERRDRSISNVKAICQSIDDLTSSVELAQSELYSRKIRALEGNYRLAVQSLAEGDKDTAFAKLNQCFVDLNMLRKWLKSSTKSEGQGKRLGHLAGGDSINSVPELGSD